MIPGMHTTPPPRAQTHASENITFKKLRWQAVVLPKCLSVDGAMSFKINFDDEMTKAQMCS